MAAQNKFDDVVASLTTDEREQIKSYLQTKREELLAARSEDARVRLAREFTSEVHNLLTGTR